MSDIVERLRRAQLNHDELRFGWLAEAADEIDRLRGALEECANDLEGELAAKYPLEIRNQYPSVAADYERDMTSVLAARTALER